jgi:hypothetical protein
MRNYTHVLQPRHKKVQAENYALPHEFRYRSRSHIQPGEKVVNNPEFYSDPNFSD